MAPARLDLRGLHCPMPVLRTRKALRDLQPGDGLAVECTDPLARIDLPALLRQTGDRLEAIEEAAGAMIFHIRKV